MSGPSPSTRLDLGFALRGGRTVLSRRVFRWPFVLTRTFLLDPVPGHMLTVILQSSSGAIHGEDRLEQRLCLAPGAAAHLATQGAAAVHRAAPGTAARERVSISVAAGALLEYMPEPRILFPGAAFDQEIEVDCDPQGMAIVADGFTLHDPSGGDGRFERFHSRTHLRIGGETVMIDRLRAEGAARLRFRAFGTITVVARQAGDAVPLSRMLGEVPGLYAAASPLPDGAGLGIRLAAQDLRALRAGTAIAWRHFRETFFGVRPADRQAGG